MAKFIFRLEAVLNVKRQQEENIKNKLGKAIQRLEAEKQKLARLEKSKEEIIAEFNNKAKKTTVYKLICSPNCSIVVCNGMEDPEKFCAGAVTMSGCAFSDGAVRCVGTLCSFPFSANSPSSSAAV
jgi:hypothetical protein